MHDYCSGCDERFEREPGQWFGAIYINLGLTLGLVVTGFALGPLVFYRLSKGLWTSIIFIGEGLYIPWPNR